MKRRQRTPKRGQRTEDRGQRTKNWLPVFWSVVRCCALRLSKGPLSVVLSSVFVVLLLFSPLPSHACGHEGWYAGLGYTQLLQFSSERQLTAGGGAAPKINWDTRWGAHGKVGYDFCGSRWGAELPVSLDRQRLNRAENVSILGIDVNALYHIVETKKGIDFYWIAGTGINLALEGSANNNTGAAGMNINFGPGLNYFIKRKKPNVALHLSVPAKYTLYFRNNLSGGGKTAVLGFPVRVGFSVGF